MSASSRSKLEQGRRTTIDAPDDLDEDHQALYCYLLEQANEEDVETLAGLFELFSTELFNLPQRFQADTASVFRATDAFDLPIDSPKRRARMVERLVRDCDNWYYGRVIEAAGREPTDSDPAASRSVDRSASSTAKAKLKRLYQ